MALLCTCSEREGNHHTLATQTENGSNSTLNYLQPRSRIHAETNPNPDLKNTTPRYTIPPQRTIPHNLLAPPICHPKRYSKRGEEKDGNALREAYSYVLKPAGAVRHLSQRCGGVQVIFRWDHEQRRQ